MVARMQDIVLEHTDDEDDIRDICEGCHVNYGPCSGWLDSAL